MCVCVSLCVFVCLSTHAQIFEAKRGVAEQETLRSQLTESASALVAKANDVIRVQQEASLLF